MKAKFTIEGEEEMMRALRQKATAMPQAAEAALYRRAEMIMARSKSVFCPVRTGNLRSTGHVRK
jgi:hypothetical protein